jgi:hypothetical protein
MLLFLSFRLEIGSFIWLAMARLAFCNLMVLLPAKLVDQIVQANYTDFIYGIV